jgi:hypothetical protein
MWINRYRHTDPFPDFISHIRFTLKGPMHWHLTAIALLLTTLAQAAEAPRLIPSTDIAFASVPGWTCTPFLEDGQVIGYECELTKPLQAADGTYVVLSALAYGRENDDTTLAELVQNERAGAVGRNRLSPGSVLGTVLDQAYGKDGHLVVIELNGHNTLHFYRYHFIHQIGPKCLDIQLSIGIPLHGRNPRTEVVAAATKFIAAFTLKGQAIFDLPVAP